MFGLSMTGAAPAPNQNRRPIDVVDGMQHWTLAIAAHAKALSIIASAEPGADLCDAAAQLARDIAREADQLEQMRCDLFDMLNVS